jgi:hypothetical protein
MKTRAPEDSPMPDRFPRLVVLAAALLLAGCASTRQTESLLTAAGFREVPTASMGFAGSTNSLPPGEVTLRSQGGTNFYVFPLPQGDAVYVGEEPQYQEYRRLLQQQQASEAAAGRARLMASPQWTGWGAWDGPLITVPTPTSR